MASHSAGEQVGFIAQWFNTWSEYQKDDFIHVLAPKVSPGKYINGIVNGVKSMDASGRPPSLFACQIKLFNDWWCSWSDEDQEKCTNLIKTKDPKFWSELEAEIDGSRKKLDEDFFTVTITEGEATATNRKKNKASSEQSNNCDSAAIENIEIAEEAQEITEVNDSNNTSTEVNQGDQNENPGPAEEMEPEDNDDDSQIL